MFSFISGKWKVISKNQLKFVEHTIFGNMYYNSVVICKCNILILEITFRSNVIK